MLAQRVFPDPSFAAAMRAQPSPVGFAPGDVGNIATLVDIARNIIKARARIFRALPKSLFHDDAWDVLFELFVSQHEGKTVVVKQLILACSSTTSGMRRIDALEDAGLIRRQKHGADHRCVTVGLTDKGHTSMTILLQDIADSGN